MLTQDRAKKKKYEKNKKQNNDHNLAIDFTMFENMQKVNKNSDVIATHYTTCDIFEMCR